MVVHVLLQLKNRRELVSSLQFPPRNVTSLVMPELGFCFVLGKICLPYIWFID
uniref:Uncharacterized protein n=1 Tax=uncultured marine virus TaxID=186617 RepID=A0A0F7L529_9VIRU|nr:hypothetical protein [uncultured marine virus]